MFDPVSPTENCCVVFVSLFTLACSACCRNISFRFCSSLLLRGADSESVEFAYWFRRNFSTFSSSVAMLSPRSLTIRLNRVRSGCLHEFQGESMLLEPSASSASFTQS